MQNKQYFPALKPANLKEAIKRADWDNTTIKWCFSTAWYGTVRHGSVRYGTAQFGSVAFPPQFSTAVEWAGLFTRRYNCAASTAVTSS